MCQLCLCRLSTYYLTDYLLLLSPLQWRWEVGVPRGESVVGHTQDTNLFCLLPSTVFFPMFHLSSPIPLVFLLSSPVKLIQSQRTNPTVQSAIPIPPGLHVGSFDLPTPTYTNHKFTLCTWNNIYIDLYIYS